MKTITCCLLSLLLFAVAACTSSPLPADPLLHFAGKKEKLLKVSQKYDLEKYGIYRPSDIHKKDNLYILRDVSDDFTVKIWNTTTDKVYQGVPKGNGPNEVVLLGGIQLQDDQILLYDIQRKSIKEMVLSEAGSTIKLREKRKLSESDRPFIIANRGENIVASGLFRTSWINYYDSDNKLLSSLDFPVFAEQEQLTELEKSLIYMSTLLSIKPDQSKVACATKCGAVISISECDSDKLTEIVQLNYFPAEVETNQFTGVAYTKNHKTGFCDIACDDEFIYVLYSGRTRESHGLDMHYCQYLLKYDWNGNPITRFELEVPLFSMDYDPNTKLLYGVGNDPEGCIFIYNIGE